MGDVNAELEGFVQELETLAPASRAWVVSQIMGYLSGSVMEKRKLCQDHAMLFVIDYARKKMDKAKSDVSGKPTEPLVLAWPKIGDRTAEPGDVRQALSIIEALMQTALGYAGDADLLGARRHLWKALEQLRRALASVPTERK